PLVGTDRPMDLAAEMATLTMLITTKVLFGVDFSESADAVGRTISAYLPKILISAREDFQSERRRIVDLIKELVDERIARPTDGRDVLTMLIEARDEDGQGLTRDQIHDEVLTLLLAGFETTANGLAWTWALLMAHPWAVTNVREEVTSV